MHATYAAARLCMPVAACIGRPESVLCDMRLPRRDAAGDADAIHLHMMLHEHGAQATDFP